jgi:hypothetical protein
VQNRPKLDLVTIVVLKVVKDGWIRLSPLLGAANQVP